MAQPHEEPLKVELTSKGVAFTDLSFSVHTKKGRELRILSGVTGWFDVGTSTALMGPSGSGNGFQFMACQVCIRTGLILPLFFIFLYHLPVPLSFSSHPYFLAPLFPGKSTLLDILSMRKNTGHITGKLKVSGREDTGYVEQFDTLVGELSVEEMLRYTSELLCCDLTRDQRVSRVNDIISRLDLEKVRNNTIGRVLKRGISGGEAKRLNIGIALVSSPKVFPLSFQTLPSLL